MEHHSLYNACHVGLLERVLMFHLLQHACSQFMELLQRCVFAPLGAFVSKGHLQGQPGQQQPLQAESSPEEDTVVALLGRAVTKVHWSTALCIARCGLSQQGMACGMPGTLELG
jgi:hypothetical protein